MKEGFLIKEQEDLDETFVVVKVMALWILHHQKVMTLQRNWGSLSFLLVVIVERCGCWWGQGLKEEENEGRFEQRLACLVKWMKGNVEKRMCWVDDRNEAWC